MKTVFELCTGVAFSLIMAIMCLVIIKGFKLENLFFYFIAGWFSCTTYNVSVKLFNDWINKLKTGNENTKRMG